MNIDTRIRPDDCRPNRRVLHVAIIGLALVAVVLALVVDLIRAMAHWGGLDAVKEMPTIIAVVAAMAVTAGLSALSFLVFSQVTPKRSKATPASADPTSLVRSVRHLSSAVVIIDRSLKVTSVNEAYERQWTRSGSEVVGRSFDDFMMLSGFGPADRAKIVDALTHQRKCETAIRNLKKDDDPRWLNMEVRPLLTEASALEGFIAVMTDVTSAHENTQALHRERERLDAILDGSDAGSYEWNVVTGETRVNQKAASMLGYRLDELPALHDKLWMRLIHTSDRSHWAALMQKHLQGDVDRFECEVRMRHRDGHWIWVLSRCKVSARTLDDHAEWVSGSFTDVGHRKAEEAALRAQHERLRNITSTMPAVAYEFELLADGSRRFNFVSEALFDIFGVKPETALQNAQAIFDAVVLEDQPAIDVAIATSAATLEPIMTEVRIVIDGETKWISVEARPRRLNNGHVIWCGLLSDITNRKISDDRLTESKALAERAVLAKSAFLATMSHEIRTPMNGVIGMAELLANTKLDEEQSDAVQTIRESGGALLRIIDDILDLSKIEAGRMSIERTSVALHSLIEGSCEALTTVAAAADVDLDLFLDPDLPDQVCCDPTRLRQVIYNLVGNAIKFSSGRLETRGHVSVRARRVRGESQEFELSVSDNGIGMSAETLQTLFVPFTQGEVSTTRRFGGSGLGLAICHRLIEMLHGRIAVHSQIASGSVFTVRLPLEPLPSQSMASRPLLDGMRCVLVAARSRRVEDLRTYLESDGAEVIVEECAVAALIRAEALESKVVVVHDNPLYAIQPIGEGEHAVNPAVRIPHLVVTRGSLGPARMVAPHVAVVDMIRRAHLSRGVALLADLDTVRQEIAVVVDNTPHKLHIVDDDHDEPLHDVPVILVAEDDVVNQKVISRQLERLGYRAEIALNGKHALRLWREGGPFVALLTDLQMPVIDGYALARSIRHEEGGKRRLPILALTANAMNAASDTALSAGIDEYLTKPVQLSALAAALDRRLKRRPDHVRVRDPAAAMPTLKTVDSTPVLDTSALTRLIGDGTRTTALDVLVMYERSLNKMAVEVAEAFSVSDVKRIAMIMHKLKSSSHAVGAVRMGNLCGELERRVRETPGSIASSDARAFSTAVANLVQALSAELAADAE